MRAECPVCHLFIGNYDNERDRDNAVLLHKNTVHVAPPATHKDPDAPKKDGRKRS